MALIFAMSCALGLQAISYGKSAMSLPLASGFQAWEPKQLGHSKPRTKMHPIPAAGLQLDKGRSAKHRCDGMFIMCTRNSGRMSCSRFSKGFVQWIQLPVSCGDS